MKKKENIFYKKIIMLTTENIQQLKKEWYSFEDIKKLIDRLKEYLKNYQKIL